MDYRHIDIALASWAQNSPCVPLFSLPPAVVKALSPVTAGKYRQVCVCVCLLGEGEKKNSSWEGRGGCVQRVCEMGGWGLLGSAVFSHTALTKTSLFSWPVTLGDALMIAQCLSRGSRLDCSSKRSLSSFCLLLTFCPGAPHINPLLPVCGLQGQTADRLPQGQSSACFEHKTTFSLHLFSTLFDVFSSAAVSPPSQFMGRVSEWWHFNYHLLITSRYSWCQWKRPMENRPLECQQHHRSAAFVTFYKLHISFVDAYIHWESEVLVTIQRNM